MKESNLGLPQTADYADPVWHLYVVETADRVGLQRRMDDQGIAHGIHYPIPVHLQEAFRDLGHRRGDFPVSEALADRILSLPMFPEITSEEIERAAREVVSFGR